MVVIILVVCNSFVHRLFVVSLMRNPVFYCADLHWLISVELPDTLKLAETMVIKMTEPY